MLCINSVTPRKEKETHTPLNENMPKPVNMYCEVCECKTPHMPGGDPIVMNCQNHPQERRITEMEKPDFKAVMIEVYKAHGLWQEQTGPRAIAARVALCEHIWNTYVSPPSSPSTVKEVTDSEIEQKSYEALKTIEQFTFLCNGEHEDDIFYQGFHSGYRECEKDNAPPLQVKSREEQKGN